MSSKATGGKRRFGRGRVDDDTLLQWLDHQPARLDKYLLAHPDALDRLDELTALSDDDGDRLGRSVAPAEDLSERMVEGLRTDPAAAQAASIVFELFALPWRTASFLVDPGSPE